MKPFDVYPDPDTESADSATPAPLEERVTRLTLVPQGEPLFSPYAFTVELDDVGGGDYVVVSSTGANETDRVSINPNEWPALRVAIDHLIQTCRP